MTSLRIALFLSVGLILVGSVRAECVAVDGPANVRASGSKTAKILYSLPKGSTVRVGLRKSDWVDIDYYWVNGEARCGYYGKERGSAYDPYAPPVSDKYRKTGWIHATNLKTNSVLEVFAAEPCLTNYLGPRDPYTVYGTGIMKSECRCAVGWIGPMDGECAPKNLKKGAKLVGRCGTNAHFAFCRKQSDDQSQIDETICPKDCVEISPTPSPTPTAD